MSPKGVILLAKVAIHLSRGRSLKGTIHLFLAWGPSRNIRTIGVRSPIGAILMIIATGARAEIPL